MPKSVEVDVASLSNEELDKLLASIDDDETPGNEPSEVKAPESSEPTELTEPTEPTESLEPSKTEESPDVKVVEEPVKIPEVRLQEKSTYDALLERIAQLESRLPSLAEKEVIPPVPSKVDPEEFFAEPDKVMDTLEQNRRLRECAIQEKSVRDFNKLTDQTKSAILKIEPSFEQYIPEMAKYLATKGISADIINTFTQNPYAAHNVPVLTTMCDLAKIMKGNTGKPNTPHAVTAPQQRELSIARPGTVKAPSAGTKIHTADISQLSDAELNHIIEKGQI